MLPSVTYLSPNVEVGFIAIVILMFQIVFMFMLFNLLLLDEKYILYVFRLFLVGAVIAALWVLYDQYTSGGDYNASGPFRGRSHTGIYMMGAFWMLLMYLFWPQTSRLEKFLIYPALGLVLYGIGTSLRQSVYVGVIVGVVALVIGSLLATGFNRIRILLPIGLVAVVVFGLLVVAPNSRFGPLALFNREFTNLGSRLESFAGTDEDLPDSENFDILQRRGGLRAFTENPFLGIGWGAFYRSEYSVTGHEMHSSPFRFLAELGSVGILLYVALIGFNLVMSARIFWLARNTPYQLSALVLMAAVISYATSHYYNRMFTDRPYWWLLVILLTFEYYLMEQVRGVKAAEADKKMSEAMQKPAPEGLPNPGVPQPALLVSGETR